MVDRHASYVRLRDKARAAGLCVMCGARPPKPKRLRCQQCLDRIKRSKNAAHDSKSQRQRARQIVLDHYGAQCSCCGETEPLFLTLDHVNGGGNEHRRQAGMRDMWWWVVRHEMWDFFRILCWNCNCGRQRNGGECPHGSSR